MNGNIGKILSLLGISRDGTVLGKWKKMPVRARRKNDTVSISEEARQLLAGGVEEAWGKDKERINERFGDADT